MKTLLEHSGQSGWNDLSLHLAGAAHPGKDPNAPEVQAAAQLDDISDRSNHLFYSDTLVFRSTGEQLRVPSLCGLNICERGYSSTAPATFFTIASEDIELLPDTHGIAKMVERVSGTYAEYANYGGWMDHSGFGTAARRYVFKNHPTYGDIITRAFVFGETANSNPEVEVNATWRGGVLATDASVAENIDSVVTGDALVSVDTRDGEVLADVHLGNLENASTGTTYSDIAYDDIFVRSGQFGRTFGENDFLRGAFYGPNHEEVAGIFEHWQGLVGAYGARREGEYPLYGTRSMPLHLRRQLVRVGCRRAALLIRLMALRAIYLHDISERHLLRSAIAHLNAGGGRSQPFTESG